MTIDTSEMGLNVYPAPILKQKAEPMPLPLPDNIDEVVERMLEIMYDYNGIGLAGPQAGLSLRVIVYDLSDSRDDGVALINPEFVHCSKDKMDSDEGCLSFPDVNGMVQRSEIVKIKGLRPDGSEVEIEADELMSAMFQHEVDHLDGITFVDRLGATGKLKVRRQLQELEAVAQG
jgi:peptide deformylase